MSTLQQQIDSHNEEFEKGGGRLELINEWTVQAVGANGTQKFRLPTVVEANDHRLPGWFLAGIWDYMGLDDVEEIPDAMHLGGWLFSFAFRNGTWRKNFTTDGQEELVYMPSSNELVVMPTKEFPVPIIPFPTKSIFHAQKLFEEKGWFGPSEKPLISLEFNDYVIKK